MTECVGLEEIILEGEGWISVIRRWTSDKRDEVGEWQGKPFAACKGERARGYIYSIS